MRNLILALVVCAQLFAQEDVRKIIEVRTNDARRLAEFVSVFNVQITFEPNTRFAVLRGRPENISAAEEALKRIQAPLRNVELTFHILSASPQPSTEKVPPELEPVVKQLRGAFPFQSYRLLETLVLRAREGTEGSISGVLPAGSNPDGTVHIEFRAVGLSSGSQGSIVRLDRLRMLARHSVPVVSGPGQAAVSGFQMRDSGIHADIDVREGQKAVVGKANMQGKDSGTLFLIVSAKVVD